MREEEWLSPSLAVPTVPCQQHHEEVECPRRLVPCSQRCGSALFSIASFFVRRIRLYSRDNILRDSFSFFLFDKAILALLHSLLSIIFFPDEGCVHTYGSARTGSPYVPLFGKKFLSAVGSIFSSTLMFSSCV